MTTVAALLRDKPRVPRTISPDESVFEAVVLMNNSHIGSLLVVDGEQLVGIITERDILFRVIAEGVAPIAVAVRDVMTPKVVSAKHDTSVEAAMAIMSKRNIRHLPVTTENRVLGVLTNGDITRWLVSDRTLQINDLVHYIARG